MLRLLGLCKAFGAERALDQVNLDIYPVEGVALLGASGAAKSTLAKILSGTLAPDAGELWVEGLRQRFTSPLSARRVPRPATSTPGTCPTPRTPCLVR
ncbi:ATP-binding cassette domain-containing protein [Pseudomonas graminis]